MSTAAINKPSISVNHLPCPDCGRRMKHKKSDQGNGLQDFLECVYCHGRMRCNSLGQPLSTPADRLTRSWRARAHDAFNLVYAKPWEIPELGHRYREVSRNKKRHQRRILRTLRRHAYAWLAERLGLDQADCHIGYMNISQCRNVITVCEGVTPLHILTWAKIERGML